MTTPDRPNPVDCAASPYTPPVHEYSHSDTGCGSVTGGAFVPNGLWPASYDGSYLFGDYVCNKIFKLTPNERGWLHEDRVRERAGRRRSRRHGRSGPTARARHSTTRTYANGGEVRRIDYSAGANQSPTASVKTTSPNYGSIPLTVSFDGSASTDPDGDTPLTYLWDFGDGTAPKETTTPTTSHTYTTVPTSSFTVTLTVRDARGAVSAPATVQIFPATLHPNRPSNRRLPPSSSRSGSRSRCRAALPTCKTVSCRIAHSAGRFANGTTTTTGIPCSLGIGNNLTFPAPPPEDLAATGPGNYLEIRLTTTDSKGLSKTMTQNLQPNRVDATFQSNPIGLSLQVNGTSFKAPRTFVSWEGYKMSVNAPSPQQRLSGSTYKYVSWSDGGGQQHDITMGADAKTYTATFKQCTGRACCPQGQFLAKYYGNMTLSGTPSIMRCEEKIDNDWGGGGPGSGVGVDGFSARWVKTFDFEGGDYTFTARADDGIRLFVDGELLIDQWKEQRPTRYDATRTLTAGKHTVKVEYYENGGGAVAQVGWKKTTVAGDVSCAAGQFLAEYYANETLSGTPDTERCEDTINNDWRDGAPQGTGVGPNNFSVRWTGTSDFEAGDYTFSATADDGVRMWVDGELIIDAWKDQGATTYQATRQMTAGEHEVKVEYYDAFVDAVAKASWVKAAGG